jgi:hypothetical protein
MKRSHEADCAAALAGRSARVDALGDLFAIGPEVVCLGDLVSVEQTTWEFHIRHYLIGDFGTLINYIDGFDRRPHLDQYIIANSVGAAITSLPSTRKRQPIPSAGQATRPRQAFIQFSM